MSFGKVAALVGVNLQSRKGEIHSVIGPNGAGKTVMMNCINGLYHPQQGTISYKGEKINHLKPYQRAKLGMSRTFQKVEVELGQVSGGLTEILSNNISPQDQILVRGAYEAMPQ